MYEKFGEFDNWEELNRAALAQRTEGDMEAVRLLGKENGIDQDDIEDFINGDIDDLCTPATAAIGKLDAEAEALNLDGILCDFKNELVNAVLVHPVLQEKVRNKGKKLEDVLALYVDKGFENAVTVPKAVTSKCSAKGIKQALGNHELKVGLPSKVERKEIYTRYYIGE